jgi:ribonuclease BN (tRNA processing enzyme)
MEPGELYSLGDVSFEMIPVNHIVPAVGYRISGPNGVFAFSGDTTTNDSFWEGLNRYSQLDILIVESAFSDAEEKLAHLARHYCPKLLAEDLTKLKLAPKVYLTHAKPGEEDIIFQECQALISDRDLHRLSGKDIFTL